MPLKDNEIFGLIEKRLLNGWILVSGSLNSLQTLEFGIYPPGTNENKNFELLNIGIDGKIIFKALVKKTQKLKTILGDDADFDKFIMIHFIDQKSRYGAYRAVVMKHPGAKKDFRSFVREQIYDFFIELEEAAKNSDISNMSDDELWEYFKGLNKKKPAKQKRNPISKSIRHEVFKRDNYKCVECGATKEDIRLHVDHILPVSQGGNDELDNLQTLCETCNLAKSNRKW